ncbi:MAG: hypothetical protein ACTTI3_08220 [Treponema sp.]
MLHHKPAALLLCAALFTLGALACTGKAEQETCSINPDSYTQHAAITGKQTVRVVVDEQAKKFITKHNAQAVHCLLLHQAT